MSLEPSLHALLSTCCQRVYPDVAPAGVATPYVTWQGLGGSPARFLNNTAADRRNTLLQINVWSTSRIEALSLIRQIEDALCASAAFIARPEGEAMSVYEEDTQLYGCIQRFNVWSAR